MNVVTAKQIQIKTMNSHKVAESDRRTLELRQCRAFIKTNSSYLIVSLLRSFFLTYGKVKQQNLFFFFGNA